MRTVRDLLAAKGREVHSVSEETTVYEALERMAERNVGALVVVAGERLVGLFSERDYARKVALVGRISRTTPVAEIMTSPVQCTTPDKSIEWCMAVMTADRVRHLPVLEEGQLAGIVSIGDIVKSVIDEQRFTIEQLERYITH